MFVRHPRMASLTAVGSDVAAAEPALVWSAFPFANADADLAALDLPEIDWDEKMRHHGRRVIVALLARGVPPERAKELAQEAWLRVIQAYRRGRLPELQLPGVVIAQANFLALDDRRRSERRYTHDPLDTIAGEGHDDGRELEGQVAARQQLRIIQSVIDRAHPNARRVFERLYGGGAPSAAEIAEELGLSVQRVRQIACELRQRIRRELRGGFDV
jgi:RNA polymerase sigma factor (sigma-70 family)